MARRLSRTIRALFAGALVTGALSGTAQAASAEEGQALFESQCAGCHTIGGGDAIGPDLQGLADRRDADWVKQFILDPATVIASGDATATQLLDQYGSTMPALGVTADQADSLLAFLGFAAAPPKQEAAPPAETQAAEPPPAETAAQAGTAAPGGGDAGRGKELFTGADRLDGGGPPCMSCHSIAGIGALGGGQLGPDLTNAVAKYGGPQAFASVLQTLPFPTMTPIYAGQPLTAAEQTDLAAFIAAAPQAERPAGAAGKLVGLSLAAVAGFGLFAVLVWRRRLVAVRRPLVNRSTGK